MGGSVNKMRVRYEIKYLENEKDWRDLGIGEKLILRILLENGLDVFQEAGFIVANVLLELELFILQNVLFQIC